MIYVIVLFLFIVLVINVASLFKPKGNEVHLNKIKPYTKEEFERMKNNTFELHFR